MFDHYGQQDADGGREVKPPIPVESATRTASGQLDYWVRDRPPATERLAAPTVSAEIGEAHRPAHARPASDKAPPAVLDH